MVVNCKIRDSDWLTFTLTIVNFNYVFYTTGPRNDLLLELVEYGIHALAAKENLNMDNFKSALLNYFYTWLKVNYSHEFCLQFDYVQYRVVIEI